MGVVEKLGIKRTAKEITKRAVFFKAAATAATALILITGITYIIALFYNNSGSFTVKLDNYDMLRTGLSLSEAKVFDHPISRLMAKPLKNVDNISGLDLPSNLDKFDGDHSTKNYLAYSFYIKNAGKSTCTYDASINILNATKNIDAAIRIRVYKNGKPNDYAKPKNNGKGAEYNTIPFVSQTVAYQDQRTAFEPQQVDKYTVVIWLEGNDPECVDSIIGGTIKMQMDFKVVESSNVT